MAAEDIEVKFRKTWEVTYHHGWESNPFESMVDDTFQDIRSNVFFFLLRQNFVVVLIRFRRLHFCAPVYIILSAYHEHIGLLVAMEDRHLFDQGNIRSMKIHLKYT